MFSFLYPFANFFQPGIFWPQLDAYKPMLLLSVIGLLVGLRRRPGVARSAAFRHPLYVLLTLFIAIQVLSLLPHGLGTTVTALMYWGNYGIFVAVSLLLIADVRSLQRYVGGMLAGGMFIVGFGIAAVLLGWPQALGGRAGAYGMYENHNDYSFLIIQIVPFLYMLRTRATNALLRLLLGAALLTCIGGIVLSLSRGGMVALVIEFGLLIIIGMEGRKRMLWLPALVLVGVAAIGLQWTLRSENQGSNYTAEDAESSRLELWRAAVKLIEDKPILGVGSGLFYENAQFYGSISHDNRGKNTHNTYLEILTGTGLVGFALFVAMALTLLRSLHRAAAPRPPPALEAIRRATLIAYYAILFRATIDAKPHDWSFYILAVIALACLALCRQAAADAPETPPAPELLADELPASHAYLQY
jgi:putative inorganic carbon (HCO3(-)) transporter